MQVFQILGSSFGVALLSGINLYATTLTLGLGIRFNIISLPEHLQGLAILARPEIVIVAGILYIMEFVADKIPWLDSLWDSVHTVIRPIGGALLGAATIAPVDASWQYLVILLCGGIAWSSHTVKAGTRLAVNHSPEPVSNIGLSIFEDILAVGGIFFVIAHPTLSLALVIIFLLLFIIFAPRLYRLLKFELLALLAIIEKLLKGPPPDAAVPMIEDVPARYHEHMPDFSDAPDGAFCVRAFSSKGIKGGKNRSGYLYRHNDTLGFISKKLFGKRRLEISIHDITNVDWRRNMMYSRLTLKCRMAKLNILFLRNRDEQSRMITAILQAAADKNIAG